MKLSEVKIDFLKDFDNFFGSGGMGNRTEKTVRGDPYKFPLR